ncbi:MAG TPA: hypothetical protein VNA69_20015 [Thermoanaerobaculia bacterium]|nr:hypothetical protein [Thermoanaerobaculia bacterium]
MAYWIPRLVFSPVNKDVAWRLLLPMLVVTGISGVGAKEQALPGLWKEILPAIETNLLHGAAHNVQPYFAASFVFAILGILFLVMILTRAVDIQLAYFAGRASFALSFLWFICAVLSLLPNSFMGLHRVFVVLVVAATVGSQFIRGGTITYYWTQRHYGDLVTQVIFIGTYLAFAWLPLRFALTGR